MNYYQWLACAILRRAVNDAKAGSLDALAWLITDGENMAELLAQNGGEIVRAFLADYREDVNKANARRAWGIR